MNDPVCAAWGDALPAVLVLMDDQHRGMFRQELQRYLAFSRVPVDRAGSMDAPLTELLIQAARAARQPAAISLLRDPPPSTSLVRLCEHILACWRDAESKADDRADCEAGDRGGIFFGPRLGGTGRPGSVRRGEPDDA